MPHGPQTMAVVAAGLLAACACHRPASSTTDLAQKEDVIHAASGEARLDAIARKCARIASCAHAHDAPRVRDPGRCVDYWLEHMNDAEEPLPACLGAASSCADIDRCLHAPASEAAAKFCAAHPGMPTGCDGDTLVTCAKDDPTESTATPCHAVGGTCGETRGAGGLVSHACLSPVLCPPDVTRATCDENNSVVACHDQAIERTPCRAGTRCRAHKDADGEEIVKEGEMDDRFYIIVEGRVAVQRSRKALGYLGTGECFGETSYVRGAKRTATISAAGDVAVMKVSSTLLEQVSAECQLRFNKVFLRTMISRLQRAETRL